MDFWSRLIGGSGLSSSRVLRGNSAAERVATFKHTCNTLDQIWRTAPTTSGEAASILQVRNCLERLNSVLNDESRGPAPHPCHTFAATSQVYLTVTKLALSSCDPGVISNAAVLFNTLIDAEVDGIVDNRVFARALVDLVRRAGSAGEEGEGRLVELLFGVANNIRLRPAILPAWFFPKEHGNQGPEPVETGKEFAGATRKDDFPFFYLLIDYVHHEGRSGDFARTGLLYIIETASRSKELERWLIESDLATLMATGLGALYSQLNRKLLFLKDDESIPHIVALSDYAPVETAARPKLGAHMDAFLSYLLFWQDTIDHCKSAEVNDTLLDHFQVLFLQQLLYPSLLESSDVDGGSTSAVITYLCRILESIDQPDLVHRILHFLLASSTGSEPAAQIPKQKLRMSLSRRKSLDLLASFAEAAAKPSPELFNLVDLVLMSIRSKNPPTVVATFQLMTVIFQRHHIFASSLIKTVEPPETSMCIRPIGALNAELQHLVSLARSVIEDPYLDQSYQNYLLDASAILDQRTPIMALVGGKPTHSALDSPLLLHTTDDILRGMISRLESFFTNSVVMNLALTEAITSLASSNYISLDGWLLVEPRNYEYDTASRTCADADAEADHANKFSLAFDHPSFPPSSVPLVPHTIQKLVRRVEQWRSDISDFDILVAARRHLLRSGDDVGGIDGQPGVKSSDSSNRPSADRQGHQHPAKVGHRSDSPRGRKTTLLEQTTDSSPPRSFVTSGSRSLFSSPLRDNPQKQAPSRPESATRSSIAADELRRRLATHIKVDLSDDSSSDQGTTSETDTSTTSLPDHPGDDDLGSGSGSGSASRSNNVTLGHILTNTIILYEFILELVALVQVRATLFQEVKFER
ncbi:uncharacterized protein BDCG_02480 [Blastomyces dermatitidis ER-3]|uniref:FHF complex subunit HOOK-interacting protein C-terminal domain-containing protein n=2 Tax=Ajellomyces dermatitidis TaxID=5039 RepID=F2T3Q6_AJEDA|nr:uncharacterized protein BDCG_02480 [Blastomyces dermatitidis ER-3]EEQ87360.1 hypothetical protein BDCG_02480 [Blastomyces dermatitidis ER-3]EGE78058.2 hypothetical protein BDDG_00995 [Blastomyces dermatitidis ATCC 18188]EQL38359.1 hypothetical protein BDFG_00711 [Blastomyces dermatitidis ATCC 26199]